MKRALSLALLGSAALLIPLMLARGQQITPQVPPPPADLSFGTCCVPQTRSCDKSGCCPKSCSAKTECCAKSSSAKAECCGVKCSASGECCKGQCCCAKTCKNKSCAATVARAADTKLLQELIAILSDTDSQEMVACTAAVLGRMGKDARPALPALLRSMERLGIIKDGDRKAEKQALLQQIGIAVDGIMEKSGTPLFTTPGYSYAVPNYGATSPYVVPTPPAPLPPAPSIAPPPPPASSTAPPTPATPPPGPSTSAPSPGATPVAF